MSHIVEARTTLKFPVEQPALFQAAKALLKEAVGLVAAQHQEGQVTEYYLDWYRHTIMTELAIRAERLPRGMAVVVEPQTGELKFVGDFWGCESLSQQLQAEIVQTYVILSVSQVLQSQGYLTSASQGEQEGQIVIQGVNYAA
jgi:hypothetical protein